MIPVRAHIALPTCKQAEQHMVCEQIQLKMDQPKLVLMNLHIQGLS